MINENWRWQPWYRAVRKLIDAGAIGQVTTITLVRHEADALSVPPFPNQRYFAEMERLLLIESVIHLIDVARFLGGEIEEVTCDLRRLSGASKGEDSVHLHLRLAGEGTWSSALICPTTATTTTGTRTIPCLSATTLTI
jgi:predicted dehydrogenase